MNKKWLGFIKKVGFWLIVALGVLLIAAVLFVIGDYVIEKHSFETKLKAAITECNGYPFVVENSTDFDDVQGWSILATGPNYRYNFFSWSNVDSYSCSVAEAQKNLESHGIPADEIEVNLHPYW